MTEAPIGFTVKFVSGYFIRKIYESHFTGHVSYDS